MLHPGIEPSDGLFFRTFRVLLLFLLIILPSPSTAAELICSHQPIVAQVGDDVILSCHLEPAVSAEFEKVVWIRPDLTPKYIHFHQDGRPMFDRQNPDYHLRTELFVDELQKGNVSMKIFRVKISDAGKYLCILESLQTEASIQLTVAVVSTPVIEVVSDDSERAVLKCKSGCWYPEPEVLWLDGKGNLLPAGPAETIRRPDAVVSTPVIEVVSNNNSDRPVLQCESGGWYPEPEVLWLDSEGNLLPAAGPAETIRRPDGLYNVSSRLTVEKSHSYNLICRVQQKNISQIRETHVHVPADSLAVQTRYSLRIFNIIVSVCVITLLCCVMELRRKLRRRVKLTESLELIEIKMMQHHNSTEQ